MSNECKKNLKLVADRMILSFWGTISIASDRWGIPGHTWKKTASPAASQRLCDNLNGTRPAAAHPYGHNGPMPGEAAECTGDTGELDTENSIIFGTIQWELQ